MNPVIKWVRKKLGIKTIREKNRNKLRKKTNIVGAPRPASINERIIHFNEMISGSKTELKILEDQYKSLVSNRSIPLNQLQDIVDRINYIKEVVERTEWARDSLVLWKRGYYPKLVYEMKQRGEDPLELIRDDPERYLGL